MIKIIWVTGGLMDTVKLAEALKELKSREIALVKVATVQEAICEMYENPEPASLVICDDSLEMSIPKRELKQATEFKGVPYLIATHDEGEEEKLLAANELCEDRHSLLSNLFHNVRIVMANSTECFAKINCAYG